MSKLILVLVIFSALVATYGVFDVYKQIKKIKKDNE